MPPRSVCLNVFTTALGNGSEVDVSMKDVEGEKMDVDTKEEVFEERARHDSVQGSPNGTLPAFSATHSLYGFQSSMRGHC